MKKHPSGQSGRWHACEFFFCQTHECVYIYIVFRFFCQTPIPAATLTADMKKHEYKVDSYKYLNLAQLVHFPFSPLAFWDFISLILILSNFIQSFQVSLFLPSFSNFCFYFIMLIYVNFYFLSRFSLLSICILSFPVYQFVTSPFRFFFFCAPLYW